ALAGRLHWHVAEKVVPGRDPPAVWSDVQDGQTARALRGDAQPAVERHGMDLEVAPGVTRREENFAAVRGPGEAFFSPVAVGENLLPAGEVHDGHSPAIVVLGRMLEERDPLAVGRDSRVREVPSRLRENFADGILQAIPSVDVPDDG